VTDQELEKTKRYVALGQPLQLEMTQSIAGQLASLETYGLDPTFIETFVDRIMAVTADDVRRVANQYVRPGNSIVVIVGDRSLVEAGIRATNLGPVEIRTLEEFVR